MASTERALSPAESVGTQAGIASGDAFHGADFDPIAFVNRLFPTEESLSGLDELLASVKRQISKVDVEILRAVRQHGGGGVGEAERGVADAESAVEDLLSQVEEIQKRAVASEGMVEEICRGIRRLDTAKRNITHTITTLRQLAMLVTTADRLQEVAERKQYPEAANLLQATGMLLAHFEKFSGIPKIAELRGRFGAISALLRQMVLDDFRRLGVGKDGTGEQVLEQLKQAIVAVEAMEPSVKQELLAQICDREVAAYSQIYAMAGGVGGKLENVGKRLDFIRTQIMGKGAQWAIFPPSWRVLHLMAHMLCKITRAHLSEMLDSQRSTYKIEAVVSALKQTVAFESELNKHFKTLAAPPASPPETARAVKGVASEVAQAVKEKYTGSGKRQSMDAVTQQVTEITDFRGMISGCFEEHMGNYVDLERKELMGDLDLLLASEKWEPEEGAEGVLSSADALFSRIKDSLKRVQALSMGRTLRDMAGAYKEALARYCERMTEKVPRTAGNQVLTDGVPKATLDSAAWQVKADLAQLRVCCAVANTAEYCQDTTGGLAEAIQRLLAGSTPPAPASGVAAAPAQAAPTMEVSDVQDAFFSLKAAALSAVALALDTRLETALGELIKFPWSGVTEVGDHSAWVSRAHTELAEVAGPLGESLSDGDFAWVCDRLAGSFIPRIEDAIGKCRRVPEAGIQQMLLDVQAVRGVLLEFPTLASRDVGGSYARLVGREAGRVESLLKVSLSQPSMLLENFFALVPGGTGHDLLRVLALKGLKAQEQAEIRSEFEKRSGQTVEDGPAGGASKRPVAIQDMGQSLMQRFQASTKAWGRGVPAGARTGAPAPSSGTGSAKEAWKKFFTG